ncbi:MAG TPA: hypothetical protein VMU43_10275 [Candidatus Acidoferrum sp.]|nr:hypothetical protein [Candidatus Acidoferrum sp.]
MKTVIRVPGSVFADREALARLAAQIGTLAQLGHRMLVVHGGNCFVSAELRRIGVPEHFEGGLRVVDRMTRDASVRVLAGQLTQCLAAAVSREGRRVLGLSPATAPCFRCETLFRENVPGKLGYEGYLIGVDRRLIDSLLDQEIVLVAPSLALAASREIQCIQTDHMAAACAEYLQADLLLFISGRDPLPLIHEEVIRLSVDKIIRILGRTGTADRIVVKLEAARRALDAGVKSVVLIRSARKQELLDAVVTSRSHSHPPFSSSAPHPSPADI